MFIKFLEGVGLHFGTDHRQANKPTNVKTLTLIDTEITSFSRGSENLLHACVHQHVILTDHPCVLYIVPKPGFCIMYVVQYMEKLSDGRTVMRSEAAESRAARQHEQHRQRRVETLLTKLQQEMEKESSGILYFC